MQVHDYSGDGRHAKGRLVMTYQAYLIIAHWNNICLHKTISIIRELKHNTKYDLLVRLPEWPGQHATM